METKKNGETVQKGKIQMTPLWVISLFVSLTETVMGVGIMQTSGNIQVALTFFGVSFPVLVAGAFFLILWNKPYVLYSPFEFGDKTAVADYVNAMSNGARIIRETSEEAKLYAQEIKNLKEISETNSAEIVGIRTDLLKQAEELEQ